MTDQQIFRYLDALDGYEPESAYPQCGADLDDSPCGACAAHAVRAEVAAITSFDLVRGVRA